MTISRLAGWLPEPGYSFSASFFATLAVIAGFGTSWQDTLAWSAAAVAVAGFGVWRKRRSIREGRET